jgi:hypothetical protein
MDPVLRIIKDVRRLRDAVANPFDREAIAEYFCKLAKDMGFTPFKNLRVNGARVDCAWKDGNTVFLAANVEFGSEREVLGAAAEVLAARPEMAVLITATNPLKPLENTLRAIRAMSTRNIVVVIDMREGKAVVVNGE